MPTTDESIWTQSVPFVSDGDPVNAAITNAPTQVLADRTGALKRIVDSIEAGEQLVLRDAPLAESINTGTVVFFDPDALVHDKALAQWRSLSEGGTELYPADTAIYVGVVTSKSADRVGDVLINGFAYLDASATTNLFGTSSPESGTYYLSMTSPGTVEMDPPAMRVRVLYASTSGVVRVFPPQHEPITHTHRSYRLRRDDWSESGTFDASLVPAGATYGYDLTAPSSIEQNIGDSLLPTVGDPSFVYLYHLDTDESSSTAACDLGGLHVDETAISLDENGLWWNDFAAPDCDIEMVVTSADSHGISIITALRSLSPNALSVSESNGIVSLTILDMPESSDAEGHIVVKEIENYVQKRGPVVSSFNVGQGLTRTSPQGSGVGDITLEIELFNDLMLQAESQNLNNSITSVDGVNVITLFPSNRASSASYRVVLPNLGDISYSMKVFAQFLAPGTSQTPPDISISLIPTPSTSGVTPTAAAADVFPAFPASITSTDVYYVESSGTYDLTGYSRGVVSYELSADTPSPAYRLLNTGLRLFLT